MMTALLAFIVTPLGRLVGMAAGALFIVVAFASQQRNIGAEKAVAKIEKATTNAIDRANTAAEKSAAGRGVQLPTYRD